MVFPIIILVHIFLECRSVGLDNLGDTTARKDRIPQLASGDEDGTGSIDFEEFLQVIKIITYLQ